jgi:hypothetical protein
VIVDYLVECRPYHIRIIYLALADMAELDEPGAVVGGDLALVEIVAPPPPPCRRGLLLATPTEPGAVYVIWWACEQNPNDPS